MLEYYFVNLLEMKGGHAKDEIILAVKPNVLKEACTDIATVQIYALIISIAAGVTLKMLEDALPGHRVVRVMPNTPCLVGQVASGFSLGNLATPHLRHWLVMQHASLQLKIQLQEGADIEAIDHW